MVHRKKWEFQSGQTIDDVTSRKPFSFTVFKIIEVGSLRHDAVNYDRAPVNK